jgi:hydroxymethylglutaryl-CoA lyase
MSSIKIVECPRDAMQGIKQWIPSEIKLDYLQSVLSVGFDVVDFGSFVSKRAIPQMSDSAYIIDQLDLSNTTSKLLFSIFACN